MEENEKTASKVSVVASIWGLERTRILGSSVIGGLKSTVVTLPAPWLNADGLHPGRLAADHEDAKTHHGEALQGLEKTPLEAFPYHERPLTLGLRRDAILTMASISSRL